MTQFSVTIKPRSLRALQRRLNPDTILEPVQDGITTLGLLVERRARQGAPRDIGDLQRSIMTETKPLFARVHSNLVYHPVMELGRRPGARMPPPAALADWARRKGFTGSLFVLARSIARRGIKGRFYMRAAAKAGRTALPKILDDVAGAMEIRWRRGS